MPKDEWIRVENTHAAIIPKEIFEEVQRILLIDTRTSPNENAVYALSGLVVCGDCGQNMVRRRIKQKDRYYTYLHCSTYKAGMGCSSHLINAEKLEKIVLESIQNQVELVMQAQAVLEQIEKIPESQNSVRVIDDQIKIQDAEIERYRDLKTKVYVDMLNEIISKGEFKDINKQFSVKMDQARKNKEALLEKRHHLLANKTHLQPWIEQFKTYRNIQELTRQVAVCVIEKIIVYSKDSVHVCFQYGERMAEMIALAELDDRKEAAVCVQ
jgi:hypothetical protein